MYEMLDRLAKVMDDPRTAAAASALCLCTGVLLGFVCASFTTP